MVIQKLQQTLLMHNWWQRSDLKYQNEQLYFNGQPITELVSCFSTPLFLYSWPRVKANITRLKKALSPLNNNVQLLYAMKANRFQSLLCHIQQENIGIDACSLEEVQHALSCGFQEQDISVTACLSPGELKQLAKHPKIKINCDSLAALTTLSQHYPNREVGIRINPGIGYGATDNELLHYSSDKKITKFGIYESELQQAIEICKKGDLQLNRVHMHLGCGLLNDGLKNFLQAMQAAKNMVDKLPNINTVNLGGGLGVPHTQEEQSLDLNSWLKIIDQVWSDSGYNLEFEPGEYIVKDAGLLLLSVNFDEVKAGKRFVSLNGGFNLAMEPAFYKLPCLPLPVLKTNQPYSKADVAGNINEALDIWQKDCLLPPMQEGNLIALINCGAYSASMASNHCMRGSYSERLLMPAQINNNKSE